jgi:protein-tyrosine phosphatase
MKDERETPGRERFLPLEALFNVRDLGGYAAAGGRRVKWGLLYRAGDLHELIPGDQAVLEERGIKTIVDFRGQDERDDAPDHDLATVAQNRWLPIDAGSLFSLAELKTSDAMETLMGELYRALAEKAQDQYREFFSLLGDAGNLPLLFHCSAGKDRTGFGAALILSALGVEREQIYDDYLLSAQGLKGKYASLVAASPYLEPAFSVRRSYLAAAFEWIEGTYGDMETYLAALGADPERLRRFYTE